MRDELTYGSEKPKASQLRDAKLLPAGPDGRRAGGAQGGAGRRLKRLRLPLAFENAEPYGELSLLIRINNDNVLVYTGR